MRKDTELTQVYGHRGLKHLGHWPKRPVGAVGDRKVGGAEPLARFREMAAGWGGGGHIVWRGVLRVRGQIFRDAAVTVRRRPERRAWHRVSRTQDTVEEILRVRGWQDLLR